MNNPKTVLNFLSPPSDTSTFNTLEHSIFKNLRKDRTVFPQSHGSSCPKFFLTLPHTSVKSLLKLQSYLNRVWGSTFLKVHLSESQASFKGFVVIIFNQSFLPSLLPSFFVPTLPLSLLPLISQSFLKWLQFPISSVLVCFSPSNTPRVLHMRKFRPTDPDPRKAICLPFSLFSHPFNFACPSNASSDACPFLSFLLSAHGSSNMQRRNKNGTFS